MYVYTDNLQNWITQQSYTDKNNNTWTSAFKKDGKTEALNREKSPSSSIWILIIIPGFTYMLGRNLELVKKKYVSTWISGSGYSVRRLINFFIDCTSLSETYPSVALKNCCFLPEINATSCSGYNYSRCRQNMAVRSWLHSLLKIKYIIIFWLPLSLRQMANF